MMINITGTLAPRGHYPTHNAWYQLGGFIDLNKTAYEQISGNSWPMAAEGDEKYTAEQILNILVLENFRRIGMVAHLKDDDYSGLYTYTSQDTWESITVASSNIEVDSYLEQTNNNLLPYGFYQAINLNDDLSNIPAADDLRPYDLFSSGYIPLIHYNSSTPAMELYSLCDYLGTFNYYKYSLETLTSNQTVDSLVLATIESEDINNKKSITIFDSLAELNTALGTTLAEDARVSYIYSYEENYYLILAYTDSTDLDYLLYIFKAPINTTACLATVNFIKYTCMSSYNYSDLPVSLRRPRLVFDATNTKQISSLNYTPNPANTFLDVDLDDNVYQLTSADYINFSTFSHVVVKLPVGSIPLGVNYSLPSMIESEESRFLQIPLAERSYYAAVTTIIMLVVPLADPDPVYNTELFSVHTSNGFKLLTLILAQGHWLHIKKFSDQKYLVQTDFLGNYALYHDNLFGDLQIATVQKNKALKLIYLADYTYNSLGPYNSDFSDLTFSEQAESSFANDIINQLLDIQYPNDLISSGDYIAIQINQFTKDSVSIPTYFSAVKYAQFNGTSWNLIAYSHDEPAEPADVQIFEIITMPQAMGLGLSSYSVAAYDGILITGKVQSTYEDNLTYPNYSAATSGWYRYLDPTHDLVDGDPIISNVVVNWHCENENPCHTKYIPAKNQYIVCWNFITKPSYSFSVTSSTAILNYYKKGTLFSVPTDWGYTNSNLAYWQHLSVCQMVAITELPATYIINHFAGAIADLENSNRLPPLAIRLPATYAVDDSLYFKKIDNQRYYVEGTNVYFVPFGTKVTLTTIETTVSVSGEILLPVYDGYIVDIRTHEFNAVKIQEPLTFGQLFKAVQVPQEPYVLDDFKLAGFLDSDNTFTPVNSFGEIGISEFAPLVTYNPKLTWTTNRVTERYPTISISDHYDTNPISISDLDIYTNELLISEISILDPVVTKATSTFSIARSNYNEEYEYYYKILPEFYHMIDPTNPISAVVNISSYTKALVSNNTTIPLSANNYIAIVVPIANITLYDWIYATNLNSLAIKDITISDSSAPEGYKAITLENILNTDIIIRFNFS